jgi:hypothetical protein
MSSFVIKARMPDGTKYDMSAPTAEIAVAEVNRFTERGAASITIERDGRSISARELSDIRQGELDA